MRQEKKTVVKRKVMLESPLRQETGEVRQVALDRRCETGDVSQENEMEDMRLETRDRYV